MAFPAEMGAIDVSPEMLSFFGEGAIPEAAWPRQPVAFEIDERFQLRFIAKPTTRSLGALGEGARILLLVSRAACERVLDDRLQFEEGALYPLPVELRAIAAALRDCAMPDAAALPYRLAKSIELLCEILGASRDRRLIAAQSCTLSLDDYQRVAAARELIDERWSEALSLARIAKHCGLNRNKLSRGFRELYRCTVTEAIVERRLAEARRQLIATDLPIGLIGYRSGYQNNASFSRAFCRKFGCPPSGLRSRAMAA